MARMVKETFWDVLNHQTNFSIAFQVVLFPALLRRGTVPVWINLCVSEAWSDWHVSQCLPDGKGGGKQTENPATNSTSCGAPTGGLCSGHPTNDVRLRLCITDPRRPVFQSFVKTSET